MDIFDNKNKSQPKILLGAAAAAHQVEGGNYYNNWWQAEQQGLLPKSGKAADHYYRYEEDFQLAQDMGLQLMRISIEWSRIEPKEGQINQQELDHYYQVLLSMRKRGLKRMVTLFHWTMPQWLAEQGGFANPNTVKKFARFSALIARELGSEIDLWITVNEPEVYSQLSYRYGLHPPFEKSAFKMVRIIHRLIAAHKSSYRAIKQILPQAQISLAKNNVYFEPYRNSFLDRLIVSFSNYFSNFYILDRVKKHLDFTGLNYYFYHTLQFSWTGGWQVKNLEGPKSDMGWRTYPKGIYHLVKDLWSRYGRPIYITENGIANAHDEMRSSFIRQHVDNLYKAQAEGADVRGYCYWSLTDTYEWHDGFNPKFGLIEVNFDTFKRRVRPSAEVFRELW